jgi:peroxiredoxin
MVSPQTEEHSRTFVERKKLSMDLLSDPGNEVAKKYGLVYTYPEELKEVYLQFKIDVAKYNGDDSWQLPLSARYIIGRDGTVRYAEVSADYTVRPDPSYTIQALKDIAS